MPLRSVQTLTSRITASNASAPPFNYEKVFREILEKCTGLAFETDNTAFTQRESKMVRSLTNMIKHFMMCVSDSMEPNYYECLLVRKMHFPCEQLDWYYCCEEDPDELMENFNDRLKQVFEEVYMTKRINPFLSKRKIWHKAVIKCLLLAVCLLKGVQNRTFTTTSSNMLSSNYDPGEYITFERVLNTLLEKFRYNNIPDLLSDACRFTDPFGSSGDIEINISLKLTLNKQSERQRSQ